MATVTIDARDAAAPNLRGWGRYTRELVACLRHQAEGIEIDAPEAGGQGPEMLYEQVTLPRHLRRTGADLVHSPNCFLPLRRPCPGVVTIHDLAFEVHPEDFSRRTGWKYRTFTPRAARSAERVICVSEHTRKDVCERYGVDPGRTRVVLSAPSLPLGDQPPPQGPYLLAVGDLRRKKNLPRLVSAFRALKSQGIPHRLILAGLQGSSAERLKATAGDAPIELPGYVPDLKLDALIRGADLLVYPSLYEGFGLAVVEAMARGTPVAASNSTALPEAGADAAAYFDPTDEDDIAATIRAVLSDPARREQMAERGLRRAAELTWERTAEETAAVYRELL
jgi:glycosyltransferase involved in cell wall biosynthesis